MFSQGCTTYIVLALVMMWLNIRHNFEIGQRPGMPGFIPCRIIMRGEAVRLRDISYLLLWPSSVIKRDDNHFHPHQSIQTSWEHTAIRPVWSSIVQVVLTLFLAIFWKPFDSQVLLIPQVNSVLDTLRRCRDNSVLPHRSHLPTCTWVEHSR